MKKLLCFILVVLNFVFLCGCSVKEAITSDKQEYIVSALGFDGEKGNVKITAETIVINNDDLTEDKSARLFVGEGETVAEAYEKIIFSATQPLSLGHSAVAIIGLNLSSAQVEDVFSFLESQEKINISIMLCAADSAFELLGCKPVSSVAVGYDIMSMVEVNEEKRGTLFKNRFYEVLALKSKPQSSFYLPFLKVGNQEIWVSGLSVFGENSLVKLINNEEIPLFCLARDSLSRGEFVLKGENMKVEYSSVTYDFSFEDNLEITLNVHFKALGDKTFLKQKTESFLKGYDVCSIGNIISQKEPEMWKKLKDNYNEIYKNANIRVNMYE